MLDEYEHEHRRLLYVAMTRAAERLIVCGYQGKNKLRPGCWYDLVRKGLDGQPGFEEVGDGEAKLWRYRKAAGTMASSPSPAEPRYSEGSATQQSDRNRQQPISVGGGEKNLPAWLTAPAAPEIDRPAVVSPSTAYDEAATPQAVAPRRRDAVEAQAQALARGTLIHRLMQSLPDVDPARREAVAQSFLARAGAGFNADDRNQFVAQALAVFADQRFAPLFVQGSRAEVPIVGRLARASGPEILVSGQVDRLAITADAVLIADYKTNRDPPKSLDAAPKAYVNQLALYRAVLGKIYPDRPIRAALVWTDIPDLMEISAAMLDQAAARITSG